MMVSIETPVFKGGWLRRCIDSVLQQSSSNWTFSLLWDGGDEQSRRILEELERERHPSISVVFAENRGIARARRFLTEHSRGEFILPLDDDDALPFHTVERFLAVAERKPWASVIRGQRKIVNEDGTVLDTPPWFPFEPRHYLHGMVTDLMNHTQPYLIRRSAYERTTGWEGFQDFGFAGEDCDLYLKLEEVGTIELLNETLYYYRIHPDRASLVLTEHGAYEMWRRLADKSIARIGLPLKRVTEQPPYLYQRLPRPPLTLEMVDFVIVAEDEQSRSHVARLSACLKHAGVGAEAIRSAPKADVHVVHEAVRTGRRPVVCLLDGAIETDGTESLTALLRSMDEQNLDVAGPKLVAGDGSVVWANARFDAAARPIGNANGDAAPQGPSWMNHRFTLFRREVANGVGGLDEGFATLPMAMVDFSLRARQRHFACACVAGVTTSCPEGAAPEDDAELSRLREKWGFYTYLLR